VIAGVGLSRTLPPVLPPNFLSRKKLLEDIAIDRTGLTLITAPIGFGKSSLVAEYLSNIKFPVIWYTTSEQDGVNEINGHLLQAIRNVNSNFAEWFTGSEDLSSTEFLSRIFGELALINQHFVLVIDNNRNLKDSDEINLKKIFDLIPPNVHTILIRRTMPEAPLTTFTNFPNFKAFGANDLKLRAEEIRQIAELNGISIENYGAQRILDSAKGWPAAVHLLSSNIRRGINLETLEDLKNFSSEPLNLIVGELLRSLDLSDLHMLEILAIFDEFSIVAAEIALGEAFSLAKIDNLATEGLLLIHTADPINKFAVNPIVRTSLRLNSSLSKEERKTINKRLSDHFEGIQEYLKSLHHAKDAGDGSRYRALFRESMRNLIATGRGKELIQMSSIVGDGSVEGILKRQTVQLIGYAADFQYENAQSLMDEMNFSARGNLMEEFISKFIAAVNIYIDFAAGRTEELAINYNKVRSETDSPLDLGDADKISILRVMAAKAIIYDNSQDLIELLREAKEIAGTSNSTLILYLLNAIEASTLLSMGEYKSAVLIANNVIAQAERYGYSGIFGPLDAMYVRARCLLEFSQIEESQILFEQIRNLSIQWSQHIWTYVAESFQARELALNGEIPTALDIARNGRDRAAALPIRNGLGTYCDLTELFIKFTIKDWDRVGILLGRLPEFLLVKRITPIYEHAIGKADKKFSVVDLPNVTAKDQIYRLMFETELNLGIESKALESMTKALEIGARVGSKETFLRQNANLLNLVIKISSEKSTVYLEELAALITLRLKRRSENSQVLSAPLTKREHEILLHLATGNPISAIGATLHVSQNTMKTHLKNIYRKIGSSGRDEAVAKAKSLYII
jgi:LuxR family maltose regulon positive regulatory protein